MLKIKAFRGQSSIARSSAFLVELPVDLVKGAAALDSGVFHELDLVLSLSDGAEIRHGDFADRRFKTGAVGDGLARLFEAATISLQHKAGYKVTKVTTGCEAPPSGHAVVPYDDDAIGRMAIEWTHQLLVDVLAHRQTGQAIEPDPATRLDAFLTKIKRVSAPVQDRALLAAARARDIPSAPLVGRMIVLGQGRRQQRLSATKTSRTAVVGNDVAANKDYCRRIFSDLGLPVPRYRRVRRRSDAVQAAREIGFPVVIKPNNGNMGQGVTIDVKDAEQVVEAYRSAKRFGRSVLVEELVNGFDYRLLVIDGKFHAASKRVPGHVVGDGIHSIEQLLEIVNSDPRRGSGPMNSWTVIEMDERALRLIAERGYTPASVPPEGDIVYLRRNANTSDGGTAVDVTDQVHPDNRDIAERAARAVGLDIAGVDLLTRDIETSMWENGGKICEINSRPGIRKHIWPAEGVPRDVLNPILDMLFPKGASARIPIVAVLREGAADATAQLLAQTLTQRGGKVGLAIGRQVLTDGRMTAQDVSSLPDAARRLVLDPSIDVAVLAIDPDDLLENGLGLDAIDVALAPFSPGMTDRRGGEAWERSRRAFRILARAARGAVLVHADDALRAADLTSADVASELVLVGRSAGARARPRRLTESNVYVLDDGPRLCIRRRGHAPEHVTHHSLPATLAGEDTDSTCAAALFAKIALHFLDPSPSTTAWTDRWDRPHGAWGRRHRDARPANA